MTTRTKDQLRKSAGFVFKLSPGLRQLGAVVSYCKCPGSNMIPELLATSSLYSGRVQPAYRNYAVEGCVNGSCSFTVGLGKPWYASKRHGYGIRVTI